MPIRIPVKRQKPAPPRSTDELWPLPDITTHPKVDPNAPRRVPVECPHCGKSYLNGGCDAKRFEACPNYQFKIGKLKATA